MTPLPVLENGSVCVVGADQRMAINPRSKHLDSAIAIVEALGQAETLDTFAKTREGYPLLKMQLLLIYPRQIRLLPA